MQERESVLSISIVSLPRSARGLAMCRLSEADFFPKRTSDL